MVRKINNLKTTTFATDPRRIFLESKGYVFASPQARHPKTPKLILNAAYNRVLVVCNPEYVSEEEQVTFAEKVCEEMNASKRWTATVGRSKRKMSFYYVTYEEL